MYLLTKRLIKDVNPNQPAQVITTNITRKKIANIAKNAIKNWIIQDIKLYIYLETLRFKTLSLNL